MILSPATHSLNGTFLRKSMRESKNKNSEAKRQDMCGVCERRLCVGRSCVSVRFVVVAALVRVALPVPTHTGLLNHTRLALVHALSLSCLLSLACIFVDSFSRSQAWL